MQVIFLLLVIYLIDKSERCQALARELDLIVQLSRRYLSFEMNKFTKLDFIPYRARNFNGKDTIKPFCEQCLPQSMQKCIAPTFAFRIEHGILRVPCAAVLGQPVHFEGQFPGVDGKEEYGAQGYEKRLNGWNLRYRRKVPTHQK